MVGPLLLENHRTCYRKYARKGVGCKQNVHAGPFSVSGGDLYLRQSNFGNIL